MTDSSQLLRMLEPAVRPIASPQGSAAQPAQLPIEHRSFESLLSEAKGAGEISIDDASPQADGPSVVQSPAGASLLGPLSQVGAIENTSLRALVERGRQMDE